VIPAESGELASGLNGEGRMAEPENIVHFIKEVLVQGLPFAGKKILITAGPTYEAIDPVRFIGNRSSGKMGLALAETLAEQGAEVCVVLGPSAVGTSNKTIELIHVESADEMYAAVMLRYKEQDVVICSAAVADYKPLQAAESKIKKKADTIDLALTKNPDILAKLGELKKGQFLVGFALETENLLENAVQKLKNKNLDLIVANAANEPGVGFGHDTNAVSVIDTHNNVFKFELKSKVAIANDIVNLLALKLKERDA
ncbi:MAG: bifunctional phosphopantothenoylcysteine decarboxylase/phosphopantothenate--cysteine ligase CoaBC, partial [Bacteroidota bacterium]